MSKTKFISPMDQPEKKFRLIDWLDSCFQNSDFDHFLCAVAFAKISPFYKLNDAITGWQSKGNDSVAVFGIDHQGTSYQALDYCLGVFSMVKIIHASYSTFHPKLFIFYGEHKAEVYCGSSNFTSGGLETNFECGLITTFSLPQDSPAFSEYLDGFQNICKAPYCKTLDRALLETLADRKVLLDEAKRYSKSRRISKKGISLADYFPPYYAKPARRIPSKLLAKKRNNKPNKLTNKATSQSSSPIISKGFVIQVNPHKNGEIFLSKKAIDQNPSFFGYPFTGKTTPKKANNDSYPQREPDPIVNIFVFDKSGSLCSQELLYPLNTIFYSKRSEIRITITPSILNNLQNFSQYPILVMQESDDPACDYDLLFYAEGSSKYNDYLSLCDQALPPGGNKISRKMGWF